MKCCAIECIFGPRCDGEATWRSPAGPLCEGCAQDKLAAVRKGGTLLNVIAAARGVSIDDLIAKFERIN